MTSDANTAFLRDAFDAWARGERSIFDVLADDARWTITGTSPVAGTYTSREQLLADVITPLTARLREPIVPTVRSMLAEGDTVVAVWDGHAVANDGRPYDNTYCWIMRFDGDEVVEVTAFFDSRALADLWTRVDPPGAPTGVDTGERVMELDRTADEHTTLTAMLDWYREGVVAKVRGISPEHARTVPFRSATSVAGLVKHLVLDEDGWFTERFAGRTPPGYWGDIDWDDPDWDFHSALEDPIDELLTEYEASCARSRAAVAGHELDDLCAVPSPRGVFSLRFVLTHMLEETARHLGHLDILCEMLDGRTGD